MEEIAGERKRRLEVVNKVGEVNLLYIIL